MPEPHFKNDDIVYIDWPGSTYDGRRGVVDAEVERIVHVWIGGNQVYLHRKYVKGLKCEK